ncbi:MAG: DUF4859 domain-containing protein [Dysgonamonadaceae bacterium]
MKKRHFYILLILISMGAWVSCGDNSNFTNRHTLTQDESDEIRRQDSIKEAQKNKINADLVLEYTIDIVTSKTLYDGTTLAVDMDKIAELFGLSVEQLLLGIEGKSNAPEIKGFAIQGSTRQDVGSISNTNAPWGHWWDKNGDLTTWGTSAMVFVEYDTEEKLFTIGQYPGRLEDGQTIKIIECLKYNEKRAAVVITIKAKTAGAITAPIVNTQEISINVTPRSSYDQDPLKFNLAQTMADLDISSMENIKFLGVKEDGSYAQEAVTGTGFWYDMNGFVGEYGVNASVYTTYGNFEDNEIGIGQMPNNLKEGQSLTIRYAFLANNKIEMFRITVNVIAYEDPETPPAGAPATIEKNITWSKPWSNDYASVQESIRETLRNAFKMTTYQIHKAIASKEMKVYLNTESTEDPTYTGDAPGYWINKAGESAAWAEGIVWCSIGHSETELYLYGGNHPDNAVAGDAVSTKMIVTCNGGKAIFNITFTLTSE